MLSSASCAPEHKVFLWFLCSTRYTLPFVLTLHEAGCSKDAACCLARETLPSSTRSVQWFVLPRSSFVRHEDKLTCPCCLRRWQS
jgi:hypothetical protein